jgi:manganese efflux pump family protein
VPDRARVLDWYRATLMSMALKIVALVLPLGLDTFAVSAALGIAGTSPRQRLRTSMLFAAFEGAMPLVGLAVGRPLGTAIGSAAEYIAIGVLALLALHLLVADEDEPHLGAPQGRGVVASIALGLSVSLDELAIGFTVGLLRLPVIPVIILIAVQAFVVTQVGMRVGDRVGERIREGAERLAGVALGLLAIGLLIAKLAG